VRRRGIALVPTERLVTHRQVIEMYRAAVTPGFIRQQQATTGRDLTPEEFIDLRSRWQ